MYLSKQSIPSSSQTSTESIVNLGVKIWNPLSSEIENPSPLSSCKTKIKMTILSDFPYRRTYIMLVGFFETCLGFKFSFKESKANVSIYTFNWWKSKNVFKKTFLTSLLLNTTTRTAITATIEEIFIFLYFVFLCIGFLSL